MTFSECQSASSDTESCDEGNLWHKRLAHINEKGLNILQKRGLLNSANAFKLNPCEECIKGKSTKLPYKQITYRAERCLEYLHCDLWSPSRIATLGGARFFMSIIDDCSRKLWIFL